MSSSAGKRTAGRLINYSEPSESGDSAGNSVIASYDDDEYCPSDDSDSDKAGPSTLPSDVPDIPPYTPPRTRYRWEGRDTSDEFRQLVKEASPIQDRCLMSLAPNTDNLHEYAHMLHHSTPIFVVDRMEVMFGAAINLNSRYNMALMNGHYHTGLDRGLYGFSPPIPVLMELWSVITHNLECAKNPGKYKPRSYLEVLPNRNWSSLSRRGHWNFKYIPINRKEIVTVFRVEEDLSSDPPGLKTVGKVDLEQPLAELGDVWSHVHPIFMLVSLGEKLHKYSSAGKSLPALGIQTSEQMELCNIVRSMTVGMFDEPTPEDDTPLDDQDSQKCEGRTRSQTAAASLNGTTAIGSSTVDGGMESESKGTGKRFLDDSESNEEGDLFGGKKKKKKL